MDNACTCTYASYVKYAGGTGFDISRYDPQCPEHGEEASFPSFDFTVRDEGTLVLFRPHTEAARDWIEDNVDPAAQWFGGALVVEHRFVLDIIDGLLDDDLTAKRVS